MSKEDGVLRRNLLIAKAHILLHDPPHKAWVLKDHEDVAKDLRNRILGNAPPLNSGLEEMWKDAIRRADVLASSFDRWLINTLYIGSSPKKSVVKYYGIHNIFDPRYSIRFSSNDLSFNSSRIYDFVENLGRALSEISKKIYKDMRDELKAAYMEYAFLYASLETLWLGRGLHVSPADTRVPTHTIFDHLYAAASILNITVEEKPSGYLVLLDTPGIQAFVGSARKAGDFWAGSWILSRVSWKTAQKLIEKYGPDVLITPSPRLNPYLVQHLVEALRGEGVGEVAKMLCKEYASLLRQVNLENLIRGSSDPCEEIRKLWLIPLIPATIMLVIPKIEVYEKEALRRNLYNIYVSSWKELVDEVGTRLKEKEQEILSKIVEYIYNKSKQLLEEPPTSPLIYIVDLRSLYDSIVRCLEGSDSACEKLGLNREIQEISKKIVGNNLEKLAEKLLWHIAITRGPVIEARYSEPPIPSSYWYLEGDDLKPKYPGFEGNWRTCSLDNLNPAIIYLGKRIIDGEEKFDRGLLRQIYKESIGLEPSENDLEHVEKDLRKILIRPGEALCPYCFFKRITYITYSSELRKAFKLSSTDDVALTILDERGYTALVELNKARETLEKGLEEKGLGKEFLLHVFLATSEKLYGASSIANREGFLGRDLIEACTKAKKDLDQCRRVFNKLAKDIAKSVATERTHMKKIVGNVFKEYIDNGVISDRDSIIDLYRPDRIHTLFDLRTFYAIIKGDADNMGKILGGNLPWIGEARAYAELLLEEMQNNLKGDSDLEALKEIKEAFRNMLEITRVVDKEATIMISPAFSVSLSISLMVSALKQANEILSMGGFPIYIGGDDLLALLPTETALMFVNRSRKIFWGDYNMFHTIKIGERIIPLAPAIPTGQSYSLRFAQLTDIMSREIARTSEALENLAKHVEWKLDSVNARGNVGKKDSLVISDSRSNVVSIIPLSLRINGEVYPASVFINGVSLMWITSLLGVLSANLPEDFENETSLIFSEGRITVYGEPLKKIFIKILGRNIPIEVNKNKVMQEILNKLMEEDKRNLLFTLASFGSEIIENRRLIDHIVSAHKILRGYP